MRVLVCGGRQFMDSEFVSRTLDDLDRVYKFSVLIEGDAPGVDRLAGEWADRRGIILRRFPANWAKFKRKAGPIRNKQMLDEGQPELVVAFPGERGTANMCRQAEAVGVTVIRIEPPKIWLSE